MQLRITLGLAALSMASVLHAAADEPRALARDIFKQLIEIPTTESKVGSTPAAELMAQRFRDAGFAAEDVQLVGPEPRKMNAVVRLRGKGKAKPVLLIAHLDVVEALREDWSFDPFTFLEQDGYFFGRGTQDMKDAVAIMATTLLRYKRENFRPDRDIILAMTADEESGNANGVEWLLKHRRDLVDAEFVLNHDGAGVVLEHGKAIQIEVTASEKVYADFDLKVVGPGGHSSVPRRDNAIYTLTAALERIAKYNFPFELNNVTRAYYDRIAHAAPEPRASDLRAILKTPPDTAALARISQDPLDNATIRTTCVATRLSGGHANNALPQLARASVNCRILPGHSPEEVRQELMQVVGDKEVEVRYMNFVKNTLEDVAPDVRGYAPPPLRPEVMQPLTRIAAKFWPGAVIIPSMSVGATDGVYTSAAGLPTYLVSGEALDREDIRAHGQDERIGVDAFYRAVDFYYEYLRAVVNYR